MTNQIKYLCRVCGRTKTDHRERFTPKAAVLVECECPKCSNGWQEVRWFDADGKRIEFGKSDFSKYVDEEHPL